MSNQKVRSTRKIFFIALILLFGLWIPLLLLQDKNNFRNKLASQSKTEAKTATSPTLESNNLQETAEFLSAGNKILIRADSNPDKQDGTRASRVEDYVNAQKYFTASLRQNQNDPETLIYLNNTKAVLQGNELTIGVSVPIGGNLNVAQEILRGVAQAQAEINTNEGIDDRLIKIVIANDNNNPQLAQNIATKFVQSQEIMAVIGHNSSDASLAAAPIYQEAGLVMITPTSSAKDLPQKGSYIFRVTPSTRALADKLADRVVNVARKTNIAICADNEAEASKSFKSDFTWAVYQYGGVINTLECNFSAADFSPSQVPANIISSGADALLIAPSLRFINQALEIVQNNRQKLPLFGSHTMYTFTTLKQGQQEVKGMVLPVAWYPEVQNSFVKDAQRLWGQTGNWRTAMAYDATKVAIEGMKRGKTRTHLQEVLSNPEFSVPGASEPIRFMSSGDRIAEGVLVRVVPGTKSGIGYDFAHLE